MNLYHIQDDDTPMYVLAESYAHAHAKWEAHCIRLNDGEKNESDCKGISFIAHNDEILP